MKKKEKEREKEEEEEEEEVIDKFSSRNRTVKQSFFLSCSILNGLKSSMLSLAL